MAIDPHVMAAYRAGLSADGKSSNLETSQAWEAFQVGRKIRGEMAWAVGNEPQLIKAAGSTFTVERGAQRFRYKVRYGKKTKWWVGVD